MQEILAITLQGMQHDMARLERVGMNLANALTPGYKREMVSVSTAGYGLNNGVDTFQALVEPADTAVDAASRQSLRVHTDLRPGSLRSTGQALDIALTGAGYFEIQTPEGPAYTRQGNFRLDGRGRLVTALGQPVMGISGEIVLPNASPSIDDSGRIYDRTSPGITDHSPIAQIKIVRIDKAQSLQKLGDGLYAVQGQSPIPIDSNTALRQGFLENSNVSSMQEMIQMIQTMRHFESMQKVALGYDEMIGTAVRKLGDLS